MKKIRIGKASDNDFVLKDKLAEAYHAELFLDDDGSLEIKDLQSVYGTLVNNQKVSHGFINSGDTLQIGFQKFTYDDLIALFENDLISPKEISSEDPTNKQSTEETTLVNEVNLKLNNPAETLSELHAEPVSSLDLPASSNDAYQAPEVSLAQEDAEIMGITESISSQDNLVESGIATSNASDDASDTEPSEEMPDRQLSSLPKQKPKGTFIKLFSVLLFVSISFWIGTELAKRSAQKEVFEIQKKNIPILRSLKVKADNNLLFANCNLSDETEKYLRSFSKSVKNAKTAETYLDEFCNMFDENKQDFNNFIQKLHKSSLGLAFASTKNQNDQHFWVCINKDQKFAVMHYLNKRYALNARVAIEAPIQIIYAKDGLNWLLLREDASYPGMPFDRKPSKTNTIYLLHSDECVMEM